MNQLIHKDLVDSEPFNQLFKQNGYDSTLMISNAEPIMMQLYAFLLLTVVALIISYFKAHCCEKMIRLSNAILWNGLIRLLMETYFELLLTSTLNVACGDWDNSDHNYRYSLNLSYVVLTVCLIAPPSLSAFFIRRRDNWGDKQFTDKYGSLLQGTAVQKGHDKQMYSKILMVPFVFFARRALLVLLILFVRNPWDQISTLFAV